MDAPDTPKTLTATAILNQKIAMGDEARARVEAAPVELRRGADVLGVTPEVLEVMRAVKQQFDPHRVLAPGRIAEGL